MKEHPILFSTEMVRAILRNENPKTVTRRVLKLQGEDVGNFTVDGIFVYPTKNLYEKGTFVKCPFGKIGDSLWVRETFGKDSFGKIYYKADDLYVPVGSKAKWEPSIFMPREDSRILLEIIDIRAERLQNITSRECVKEGFPMKSIQEIIKPEYLKEIENMPVDKRKLALMLLPEGAMLPREKPKDWFKEIWDSINKKRGYGWDKNPFVWRVEFRRIG